MDANVLSSLKQIPCPNGDACPNINCLFQHPKEAKEVKEVKTVEAPTQRVEGIKNDGDTSGRKRKEDDHLGNFDSPKKRLRTDDVGKDHALARSTSSRVILEKDNVNSTATHELESLVRPVSPPPLKRQSGTPIANLRKPGDSPKPSGSSPGNQSLQKRPSARRSTPASGATAPSAKALAKTETLNPRMVAKPPAKYETRLKLLKLIHTEISRLNDGLAKSERENKTRPSGNAKPHDQGPGARPEKEARKKDASIALSAQDLIVLALGEEETAALDKPDIYTTAMRNVYMKYKRMTPDQWWDVCKAKQSVEKPAWAPADGGKQIVTGLTPTQEATILRRLLTPIANLSTHGYVSSIPSDEDVAKARAAAETLQGWEKCARCDRRFQVFPGRREEDGALTSGGICVHHPGKTYFQNKQPGDKTRQPKRYKCCGEAVGDSSGCTRGDTHVFKVSDVKMLASVTNFVETPENDKPHTYPVCFDCEMGYTVYGLEMIRVTATSWPSGDLLLDVLVRPKGEVLDLNSRYSGVFPEDMVNAEPYGAYDAENLPVPTEIKAASAEGPAKRQYKIVGSPEAARALFFSLISPSTPLIGHGLENDLNALRVIHPTIVDTILLYPHKQGLPYRLGLKMLADQFLDMKIQLEDAGSVRGHDSAEDARAAGALARLKVKDEWDRLKLEGWSVVRGNIVSPD